MIVLIIKIIIAVTLIYSDLCPTVSWWVLEFLPNYAWKVLENNFTIMLTNCVGALCAVVRTRCTPWGILCKIITWHTTFPVKPHKYVTEPLIMFQGGNASVYLEGLKLLVMTTVNRKNIFFPQLLAVVFPFQIKMSHFSKHQWMVLLDLTALFQNWKEKNNLSEKGGFWQHPEK